MSPPGFNAHGHWLYILVYITREAHCQRSEAGDPMRSAGHPNFQWESLVSNTPRCGHTDDSPFLILRNAPRVVSAIHTCTHSESPPESRTAWASSSGPPLAVHKFFMPTQTAPTPAECRVPIWR